MIRTQPVQRRAVGPGIASRHRIAKAAREAYRSVPLSASIGRWAPRAGRTRPGTVDQSTTTEEPS